MDKRRPTSTSAGSAKLRSCSALLALSSRLRQSASVLIWSRQVPPVGAIVTIADAECQFEPSWRRGRTLVDHDIFGLVDPEHPPYPSFAVATRREADVPNSGPVTVTVLCDEAPDDLIPIHSSVLYVGGHGVLVGNERSIAAEVDLAEGCWPLQIWTDSPEPDEVARVSFVVSTPSGEFHLTDAARRGAPAPEACPVCASAIGRWALLLEFRPDDGQHICKRLVRCAAHGHITWRWEDRPDDPPILDDTLSTAFS